MSLRIEDLLRAMVGKGASDLHIKAGSPPGFRIDGEVQQQEELGALSPEMTADLARQIMSPEQLERFQKEKDIDFSYAVKDLARFRVNALHQRNAVGLVVRQIPDQIPDHKKLGLPQICLDLAAKPRGLVLVTGPTGSGKSTTLAAMIDYINQTEHGHILTMEDPLEFVHPDKKCFVTQRQIGQDCSSFREGLRRALRQDPDVILIGEMRDLETISMAITAAETGHLVFGTLHTTSAISTIDRIIDVFPTDAQQQVRVQLAGTLQGVVSQTLVAKQGGGRVAAREILVATDAVRSLIREAKSAQILNIMQTGKQYGMVTLEDELLRYYAEGQIGADDTVMKANRPDDVRRRLSEIKVQAPTPTAATTGMSVRAAGTPSAAAPGAPGSSMSGMGVQGVRMRTPLPTKR
ncbi:MAG: type IV pilus twitching motility protein PilT [Planctomycetes bacterium]|nr:type IV pilus twitching motility protein PilT [Planctomycetota bacterium]MCC7063140.1 type IV pilus twitching motility protein PilT [Planctomycetota bacterium]